MRKRLASKAVESKRTIILLALNGAFGDNSFTSRYIGPLGLDVDYSTLHLALRQGSLKVTGPQSTHEDHVNWYRLFKFKNLGLNLIEPILSFYSCGN